MSKSKISKTALVLAGGGLTGAVYEIGALRAMDDLLIDRTVNDFDIYVGTSAGALVSSFLANGISPEHMLQILGGTDSKASSFERKHIFNLNRRDYLKWGFQLPGKLIGTWSNYLHHLSEMTMFDVFWSLTAVLPSGIYDGLSLEEYVRLTQRELGLTNDFTQTLRELFIIATDLDTGERKIFGPDQNNEIPISLAVAASSALPLVYKPVEIQGEEYVDGGLRGTASLDLAIERGATLVVCINPLVPFNNNYRPDEAGFDPGEEHLSASGIQSIANQSIRIFSHAGLHYHIKQLRRAHPEVDIILIEPKPEDYQMFYYNIMRYSARLIVAEHGFKSVTLDMAMEYNTYKQILARHGIPISRRLVIEELNEIVASNNDPKVIRKVLEALKPGCGQGRHGTPLCELNRVLADLEMTLDRIEFSE